MSSDDEEDAMMTLEALADELVIAYLQVRGSVKPLHPSINHNACKPPASRHTSEGHRDTLPIPQFPPEDQVTRHNAHVLSHTPEPTLAPAPVPAPAQCAVHMVLHLRPQLHWHLIMRSSAQTANTLEHRSSQGEGTKKRSKAHTKKLVQQERARRSLDKDAFP